MKLSLLSVGSDAKTVKGETFNWSTAILYLAPASVARLGNVCPFASDGCKLACLYSAGRGGFTNVQEARIRKTRLFFEDFPTFKKLILEDVERFAAACEKSGKNPCVRLNGTSDIAWERLGIIQAFPSLRFYDYTKSPIRALQFAKGSLPSNYHLTFSRSEANEAQALDVLKAGGNVACVFSGNLPETYLGFPVINGDESDLRFLDSRNAVVGLKAKGKAKKDVSGFVIHS
jgi:hypothetical protein